jgi:hypothetical protein
MENIVNTVELIQNEVKTLPALKAQEVLDFIIFLKTRIENDEWQDMKKAQEQPLSDIWDNEEDEIWNNV